MTRRVTQVGEADCALACLAMLTGRPLRAITSAFRHQRHVWSDAREHGDRGGGLHNGIRALEHLGFRYERDFIKISMTSGEAIPRDEVEVLTWGRRAMVSVRSRTRDGRHMCYWDGRQAFDPSPFHRRHKVPVLERPVYAIYLFREVAE